MRQIAFVRHGKATRQGDDDAGLAKKGIRQIEKTAEKLRGFGATKVFTSPLPRAEQSAMIIANKLGLPKPTVYDLVEVKDGESKQDALNRMMKVYDAIKSNSDGNVIVVSHGIALKYLIDKVFGVDGEIKRGKMKVFDMQ